MRISAFIIAIASVFLTGCASIPNTAGEFRDIAKGGHMLLKKPESFVVDRPLSAVVSTFKKRAPECLVLEATSQSKPVIGFAGSPRVYATTKPTIVASAEKMEFYRQLRTIGNMLKEPEGGQYMFLVDATPVDKQKTRIEIYRTAIRSDTLMEAITGWATGKNMGCPDPATFM